MRCDGQQEDRCENDADERHVPYHESPRYSSNRSKSWVLL
jgi:hypothetical protein